MEQQTLNEIVRKIISWRKEMKNHKIPPRPNKNLNDAFGNLRKVGMDEGLAVQIVLTSEYVFRYRMVDEEDENKLLKEIENSLRVILSERATYYFVKAIERSIQSSIRKNKPRELIAFEQFRNPALMAANPVQRAEMYRENLQSKPNGRLSLEQFGPIKSGPPTWLAPWVAGCAIHQHLLDKGIRKTELVLVLIAALFNKDAITEDGFRKKFNLLKGDALNKFLNDCKENYEHRIRDERIEADAARIRLLEKLKADPNKMQPLEELQAEANKMQPRPWDKVILQELITGENFRPYDQHREQNNFGGDIRTVKELILNHSKTRKKTEGTKDLKTSSKFVKRFPGRKK